MTLEHSENQSTGPWNMEKKVKRPIFTYIITVLNAFIPTFITIIFSGMLVIGTVVETGEKIDFADVFYPAIYFGAAFCLLASFTYFFIIRKRILRPRWWTTLLLIVLSYAACPVYAAVFGMVDKNAGISGQLGVMFFKVLLFTAIGFPLIALLSRTRSIPPSDSESKEG